MNDPSPTRRDLLRGGILRAESRPTSHLPGEQDGISENAGPPLQAQTLQSLSQRGMGCEFTVWVDGRTSPEAIDGAWEALRIIEQLEAQLSVYRAESCLSQVNREAFHRPVQLPELVYQLLEHCIEISRFSRGTFDITAGPLVKAWGFYDRKPAVPKPEALEEALKRVGTAHLRLDSQARTVRFGLPGMEINLAAIGKGYALDACADLLSSRGVGSFLIQGGQSSVLARGSPSHPSQTPEPGWPIGLIHPILPDRRLGVVILRDRALGTSGCQRQAVVSRGKRLGHVLDPRTGWPNPTTLAATVLAPSAAEADALATAFCLLSKEEVGECCAERPDLSVVLSTAVDADPRAVELTRYNLSELDWLPNPATDLPPLSSD